MASVSTSPCSLTPGRRRQGPTSPHSNTTLAVDLSDSDDIFFVPRRRRRRLPRRRARPVSEVTANINMVLITTTSRAWGDEFCDISLENAGDIKGGSGDGYGKMAVSCGKSRVKQNLKHIAHKITHGTHGRKLSDEVALVTKNDLSSDPSEHVNLPPFEIYCDHDQDTPSHMEPRSGHPSSDDYSPLEGGSCRHRHSCCYLGQVSPQASPHYSASPTGYCSYSSLMRAADDAAYGDSDTATVTSDRSRHDSDSRWSSSSSSQRRRSLVDDLLLSIYRHHHRRRPSSSLGDSDTLTEHSTTSDTPAHHAHHRLLQPSSRLVHRKFRLLDKDLGELRVVVSSLEGTLSTQCSLLVRELKKRDKLRQRRDQQNDVVTAILHALSQKRSQDTRMRFSVSPLPGDSGFRQWHDAMMMCARLPGGIPQEFRRRLWLTLAEKHLQARGVNWSHAEGFCFNEWSNPDDDDLGDQIVKDLHRTGCSLFCGEEAEDNQAMLKRVLLAFARWNKGVGYCQGFNMLAAIILEVMERQESDALKVMIYLIEGVLPESYFANNLRGLSVDMAVFRDLLRLRLPQLSRHLEHLQHDAADLATGTSYEPPLTNVFTMQWFLTLFSNCLPRETVMRVWDLTFLQGDEVLLRTALAIWDGLAGRILEVHSADEFYTVMGVLTREMITFGLMDANKLVQTVVGIAPFPFPGLAELRDKYTYNITPWTQSVSSVAKRGLRLFYSDDDDEEDNDEDDQKIAVATAFGLSGIFRKNTEASRGPSPVSGGSAVSPSNFTPLNFPSPRHAHESRDTLRPNLDISALKKQYARLRERQKQAHIILTASQLRMSSTLGSGLSAAGAGHKSTTLTMNHLLRGKKALTSKTRRVVPQGVIPVTKPKKKAERKLSDSTGTRSSSQQQQPKQPSIQSFNSLHKSTQQLSNSSKAPAKVETLHWKDTPRRDRRASLPSGVKLLEGSMPCLGTLGVPSEIDDDDGGSSTSTELCDDDDDDKLSDLEVDPSTEPRPATTSPRLETVHEDGKVTPESKHAQPEGLPEDKKQQPVSHNLLPSVVQVKELQAEISTQTLPKEETIVDNATADQVKPLLEPQDKDSTKKIQKPEVPLATEPPLWDFKAIETGIPLEDLLAGKNLTAAEIIARIPFPSDVSFMQQTTEGPNKLNETRSVQGSSSPFSTQHNVTPERSPVDSPGPRITSPDMVYEPSLTTKPSPNISPSKSFSSTPSPRASPIHKSFISSSKSPNLSPSQSQDNLGLAKLSLVGLPPVSASDIMHDTTLIPPKSPKITVEDEKRNIFEIYTGHPSPVTSTLPPGDEENKIEIYLNKVLENISIESDTCPDQIVDRQENMVNGAENVTVLPDYIKLNEAKDTETSVVESNDLENKFEDTWDTKTLLQNPKEFTWLKDSYNQCESESNGSLINASFSIETSSPAPDSTVFEAICQRLKENVIKTESDIPEVQTNFATNSGFLCLTINKEDNTLHSETQTATSIDKLDASVEDVKTSGCASPVTSTPTEALGASSWLSSFTMTANSSLIPLATSDSNLVAPLCKPSEAGHEIIEAALNKEVSPVTVSFENATSVITTSEAGSTSVFTTVDSEFSIFMKTYSTTSDIVSDDDTSLKTEIVGNLASSVTTTFNNGITHTAVSSSLSPTSFNTRVSPGTDTSECMFPCMLSRFSEFTKEFDSGNSAKKINEDLFSLENTDTSNYSSTHENLHIVGTWKNDKSSIITSEIDEFPIVTTSNSCQIISTSRSETRVPSPLATEPECSSIMETSLVSSPPLYVINTLPDIPLAFSIPTGEITYSSINVSQETSYPNDMSNEKSLKTSVNNTSLDYDPSLENEILSLIGKNQTFSESTAEKCDPSETTNSHRQTKLESSASPALSLEERILALLNIDERTSTVSADGTLLSHRSSSVDSSKSPTAESREGHVPSMENSENTYASLITTKEEILSPVPSLERESSLSASLEGRISFFTSNLKDERDDETGAYARLTEDKEDRSSDDNDAEAETDFFNGKDLSSEAIRQRLWSGVKSLSLDADITLDPNVFCFLIQQSSRQKKWKDDRKLPRRRNSEVALQELVKENTEIIERILKQKSVEGSGFIKIETPIHTPLEETKTPVHTALKEDKTPVNSALDETKTTVHTALEDTKTSVHTAVEETKTPVHTALEETKSPIHTALEDTKTPVHTALEETKTPVHTAFEETKTPVHTALEETKTAVHTTLEETKTPVHTAIEETKIVEKESENKLRETSASIKFNMENSESDCSVNSRSHKETKSLSGEACLAATFESLEGATNFVKVKEFSQATTQSKVISPQSSKTSLPEWKYNNKREDGSIALSPTRPITFNPFPTRNVPRQPKEVGVKLGLYSPTKKMSGSSTS